MSPILRLSDIHKSFGQHEVLKGIDLDVSEGEVIVILGSSGSGKSTLLRCINHMEMPTRGHIEFDGQRLDEGKDVYRIREKNLRKLRRQIGMVFQQFNLFPHMTALENVMEGPRQVLGLSRADARERALALLNKVGLAGREDDVPFTSLGRTTAKGCDRPVAGDGTQDHAFRRGHVVP